MGATTETTRSVVLRPAVDGDREFLLGVYASTRDEELSQVAWAPQRPAAMSRPVAR